MNRRTAITGLAVATIAFAILGWVGYAIPVYRGYSITDRFHFYIYTSGGLARFYAIRSQEDVYLDPTRGTTYMTVRRVSDNAVCAAYRHARPGRIKPYALLWNRGRPPRQSPARGAFLFAGIRTKIWAPVAVGIAYPLWITLYGRFHGHRRRYRKRHGRCLECGYDLTGNESGTCSECGSLIP